MPTQRTFDGATLEDALAKVTAELGRGARITHAEKVRTGGVAGFFARERFEVIVDLDDQPAAPAPAPAPSGPRSLLDLADEVSRRDQHGTATPERSPSPSPSTEGRTFREVLQSMAGDSGFFETSTDTGHTDPAPAPAADAAIAIGDTVGYSLVALGLPDDLVAAEPAGLSAAQRLLGVLEKMPVAAPVVPRPGAVLAVVGDEDVATEAAIHMADQLGQSAGDVIMCGVTRRSFRALGTGSDEMASALAQWRESDAPVVVAVCPPAGAKGAAWARDVIDTLGADTVWAAVRADRKPEDVASSVRRLGRIDALAVGGCDQTCSPAAVLTTGIPVASLEGRRATPAAWTALLVDRLAA